LSIKKRTFLAMVRWRKLYEIPENSALYNQLTTVAKQIDDVGKLRKVANKAYYKASQDMNDAATLSRSNDPAEIPGYDSLHKKLCETETKSIELRLRVCRLWATAEELAKQIEDVETRIVEEHNHARKRIQRATLRG
jgi:hypothetical protein